MKYLKEYNSGDLNRNLEYIENIFEKIYKLTNCKFHTFFLKDPDNTISTRNHAPNTRFPCSIILEFKKD